jgi:hypothetical protein
MDELTFMTIAIFILSVFTGIAIFKITRECDDLDPKDPHDPYNDIKDI